MNELPPSDPPETDSSNSETVNEASPSDVPFTWWSAIKEALGGTPRDFTSGSIVQACIILAIPMVLEMLMESAFALCDAFYVSKLGESALAVVGLTEAMLTIIYAFGIGFSMATTALVARRIGEKNPEGASQATQHSIWIALTIGLVTGIPCFIFAPQLLSLIGAEAQVIEEGSGYTSILLGTNVVIVLLFINNAAFRGAGNAAVAMKSLWLANGLNIILDPCLIFGWWIFPEMGVKGAAVATTIGRGIGVAYQFWELRSPQSRVRIQRFFTVINWALIRELFRLSIGGIAQFLIATASWVVLMRIVALGGSAAVAGYTVAIRVILFFFLPAWGLSNAVATLVGQNLGAQKPDRAERSVWLTGVCNMIYMALVTVLFVFLPEYLMQFFTEEEDITAHGIACLRIFSYGYVFYSWALVFAQAFNGAGDTMTPTWMNFLCFWIIEIPLAYFLAVNLGYASSGVFWAVCIAETILAFLALFVFLTGKWKKTKIEAT